jgi:REP element-mobilizing transposase RayT
MLRGDTQHGCNMATQQASKNFFCSFILMDKSLLKSVRKSHIERGEIYFWTATINKWQRLLEQDEFKEVIISSLQYLTDESKIDVFAFVIMPNHLHFIWRIKEPNGKESPQGSFMKYTAHTFQKMLKKEANGGLSNYSIDAANKKYEFWQRDSLAVPLFTKKVAIQKLKYIHRNPLAEHWQLVKDPCDYKYSSARYYERDEKNFSFLKDLWDEF